MYRVSLEPKTIRKMKKGISNAMIEIRFRGVRKTLKSYLYYTGSIENMFK